MFLPIKDPCGISGKCLTQADNKKCSGHKIQREYHKLDANPQHQRHTKDAAQNNACFSFGQKQPGSKQVCHPVYKQQCPAGKHKILEKHLRKGQYLKIRQHGIHAHEPPAGVKQHTDGTTHCADAHKKCPENQNAPGRLIPRVLFHIYSSVINKKDAVLTKTLVSTAS